MSAVDRVRGVDVRSLGLVAAAVVAVLGLLSVFSASVDVGGLVESRTSTLLGVAGIAGGAALSRRWIRSEERCYRPPERERRRPVDVPGDDVDDRLAFATAGGSAEAAQYYRSRNRQALRELAVDVLVTRRGETPDSARQHLRDGSWTADERAAAFFRLGGNAGDEVTGAVRQRVGRDHPHVERARAAVAELTRIAEEGA